MLILSGVSMFFLVLTIAYSYSTFGTAFNDYGLPVIFHANTIIILMSSFVIEQAYNAIGTKDSRRYYNNLRITLILGLAFILFQILGWVELFQSGVTIRNNLSGSYLVLISFMHILHIIGGLVPLIWWVYKAYSRRKGPRKDIGIRYRSA